MPRISSPLLVASYGNDMAADDAFGPLVSEQLRAMAFPDVEIVDVGMQPFGLFNHLNQREGLVVVDASQASQQTALGSLLSVDFFDTENIQLIHDIVLSSHGLSVADELELAKRLFMLPPRVQLVTLAVESFSVGSSPTPLMLKQIVPAALLVSKTLSKWQQEIRHYSLS